MCIRDRNLRPSGNEKAVHFASKPVDVVPLELHAIAPEPDVEPITEIEIPTVTDQVEYKEIPEIPEGGRPSSQIDKENLEAALGRLMHLRERWIDFKKSETSA